MERIEGHWIGALGMNVIVTFGTLLVTMSVGFVLTFPDIAAGPILVAAISVAILVPLIFFPFSRTLWSAIDLAMRPLEPDDDVEPIWIPPGTSDPAG